MNFESLKHLPNSEQLKKSAIGAGVGLLIWAALYFLFYAPVLSTRAELTREIETERLEYVANKALAGQASTVERNYLASKERLGNVIEEQLVPSDAASSPLTWVGNIIQDNARNHNVQVQNLSNAGVYRRPAAGRDAPPPMFEEFRVNLEVRAGYHDFGRFVAALEKQLPYAKFDSVRFRRGRGGEPRLSIVVRYGVPMCTADGFPLEQRP